MTGNGNSTRATVAGNETFPSPRPYGVRPHSLLTPSQADPLTVLLVSGSLDCGKDLLERADDPGSVLAEPARPATGAFRKDVRLKGMVDELVELLLRGEFTGLIWREGKMKEMREGAGL